MRFGTVNLGLLFFSVFACSNPEPEAQKSKDGEPIAELLLADPASGTPPTHRHVILPEATPSKVPRQFSVHPGGGPHAKKPTPQKTKQAEPAGFSSISGKTAALSVMSLGADDCRVLVGGTFWGISPMFRKVVPTGTHEVRVNCAGAKTYATVLTFAEDAAEKVIIKPDMWQKK